MKSNIIHPTNYRVQMRPRGCWSCAHCQSQLNRQTDNYDYNCSLTPELEPGTNGYGYRGNVQEFGICANYSYRIK